MITRRGLEKRQLLLETIALRREKAMLSENFTGIVSHELKSPLAAVQQNLFVLEHELGATVGEGQKHRLERMKIRIGELIEIINKWLRIISVDIEVIKDDFRPVAIPSIITKAVEYLQPYAIRKDIDIVSETEEPQDQVYGDEGTLTEVLVNLGNNAIKYSYSGSKVYISSFAEHDVVLIKIKDSGVGIPEEDQAYIFEDFFSKRLGQTEERGHGLGLALSRRIIEAHEGTISLNSKPGVGSEFVIRLPSFKPNNQSNSQIQSEPVANA